MAQEYDFRISNLGTPKINSPITYSKIFGDRIANYVTDDEKIIYDVDVKSSDTTKEIDPKDLLEKAGPREKIYFSPKHVHAAIVTCGGLCPGLNDVIRATVRCLWERYGVKRITGIKYGYKGFLPEFNYSTIELNPDEVDDIHKMGGTILGSSRGEGQRIEELADSIERLNINILFTIGGDGTQKGSLQIAEELEKRGLKISVIGIPKTIDNDLSFTQRSFGFETAVDKAVEVVASAHTEAASAINGIGMVKVMGRDSGFIAAQTAVAVHEANFVLIPEVPFDLDGENGFLMNLKKRLLQKDHAVILVAEGAGQDLFSKDDLTDASGNKILKDIGVYLKDKIKAYFKNEGMEVNLKYIDPSYIIRSSPAIPSDASYCTQLGNNAVHAAMAGKTKLLIGLINNTFVHVPTKMAVTTRKKVDPEGSLWRDVIEATSQPIVMTNPK